MKKNKNILYVIMIFLCLLHALTCPAQVKKAQVEMPDFKHCFEAMRNNQVINNRHNDSLYLVKNHDEWIKLFHHRMEVNHQLYDVDAEIMHGITDYFAQDSTLIPTEAYLSLFHEFYEGYMARQLHDPFMLETICGILERVEAKLPDSLNYVNMVHFWRYDSYAQMANLGGDAGYLKKAYSHWKFLISDESSKYPYYKYTYPRALLFLPRTMWLIFRQQTVAEYKGNYHKLDEFLARPDLDQWVTPKLKAQLLDAQWQRDEALVRNVYMLDSTLMRENNGEQLMREVVEKELARVDSISDLSYVRVLYMQMWLGQITAKEAWDKWMVRYNKLWKEVKNKRLENREFILFLKPFYTIYYFNHMADIPEAKKRKNARKMCEDLEQLYKNRKERMGNTDFVRDLNRLVTDKWMVRYLTPEERVRFINSLTVATHIATYAHSVHVSKIAEALMEGVLRYQPELLKGAMGYKLVEDIKANTKDFMTYIHEASLYHDLGKNSILTVVNTDYRPLSDEERRIIRRHPALAMQYLKLAPSLNKYHDITLGHHKWYNGKGGYPADFDNTKSSVRILIDILHISDDIQASIETLGAASHYKDTFAAVMKELRAGAGTKYNPDLVKLIDAHKDVADKLAWLVGDGWGETYYEVYKNYSK